MKYRVISADCHMDFNYLPADTFTSRLPAKLDNVPSVVKTKEGMQWVSGSTALGTWVEPGASASGAYSDVPAHLMGNAAERVSQCKPGDPAERIANLDRDGVDAEVIYGIQGVGKLIKDPALRAATFRAYNDYMAEFCSAFPERLFGLGQIPMIDGETAAAEVYRIARLGLTGAQCTYLAAERPLWDATWEPLWAASEEIGLPVTFHIEGGFATVTRQSRDQIGAAGVYHSAGPMQLDEAIAAMIWSKALERHPRMRVVYGESGFGWIPFLLERMDYQLEDRLHRAGLKLKPSEYWRRQCFATYQKDLTGMRLLDLIGEETVMWGSDYPHPDSLWPGSRQSIAQHSAGIAPTTMSKLVCENAMRVYRIGG